MDVEHFDPALHDRSSFVSGVSAVDNYLHRTANKLSKADNVRVYVMSSGQGVIVGYYALNAHTVSRSELPQRFARSSPGHGSIPAVFIAMMGIDHRHAGQGLGSVLLADALKRIEKAAREIGVAMAVLDVLDCGNPDLVERRLKFYTNFGFSPFSKQTGRLFLPVQMIRETLVDPA